MEIIGYLYVFKPGVPQPVASALGFLKSLSCGHVCMLVCVCKITSGVIFVLYDQLNNFCCFSVPFMALVVDVIYRHGPSNEMCRQL